jgi:type III pantothenate kinase
VLLALDVGNSEITAGLFQQEKLVARWRLTTQHDRTPDEWGVLFSAHLDHQGKAGAAVKAVALASVVPQIVPDLVAGLATLVDVDPTVIGAESKLPITLDVEEPRTVGADRVVNTLAACELYKRDTIVVDFGTATTFDCITADRRFIGGVIAPGVAIAAEQLIRKTAKLPATELTPPARAIGRRTEDCVRAGVLFGAADSADGMVRRIKAEWPNKTAPLVVATGGLARLIAPLTQELKQQEPDLTLIGLRLAARHLGLAW